MVVAAKDPERLRTLAQYRLLINGADAPAALVGDIQKVVMDERLDAPTMIELRLFVPPDDPRWIDEETISIGKEIELFAGYAAEEESLCVAKVTSVDLDFDDQMPSAVVRGYDLSFGLRRDVKSRSFLDQADSNIAEKIATEAPGLTPKIDPTGEQHPYVLQHAQTNYDFLRDRARRNGYEFRVAGRELHFRRPQTAAKPIELRWGSTLKRFSPRLSVADQVSSVEVRSWDTENKAEIVATAELGEGAPTIGETRKPAQLGDEVWGKAVHVIPHSGAAKEGEARALAQATLDDLTSSFVQATGECAGDPKVRVGAMIDVQNVGKRFSGEYYVTAARHTITKADGHLVEFSATTRRPNTIASIFNEIDDGPATPHIYVGIVTDNNDPLKLGRVKVGLPTLFTQDTTFWARLVSPMAGKGRGFYALPEIDDEVVVAFEGGNPTRPYILGALWSTKDMPPETDSGAVHINGGVGERLWRSRSGHLFIFDDRDGQESIRIIDKTGQNHIVITSSDNKLDVRLEGDIQIKSATGKISMSAEQDIAIESSSGNVILKGVNTEFEAQNRSTWQTGSSFDVKTGTSFAVQAGTEAALAAATNAKISGAKVAVDGQAQTSIKGGIVNIN